MVKKVFVDVAAWYVEGVPVGAVVGYERVVVTVAVVVGLVAVPLPFVIETTSTAPKLSHVLRFVTAAHVSDMPVIV